MRAVSSLLSASAYTIKPQRQSLSVFVWLFAITHVTAGLRVTRSILCGSSANGSPLYI